MKLNFRILAVYAFLFIASYNHSVNSFNLPSFSGARNIIRNPFSAPSKYAKPGKRARYKRDSTKSGGQGEDESDKPKRPTFRQILERFSDPLSRDFPPNFRRNYAYFLLLFMVLVSYGVYGYHRNKKMALAWSLASLPVLEDNFAYVEKGKKPFQQEGWNDFEMYASGRTSCRGMFLKLELKRRQCFWHENFIRFFYPQKDKVSFEVHFESLDLFMFAVCRKLKNKAFVNDYQHLLYFSSLHESKDFPDDMRVYVSPNDKSVVQYGNYFLHEFHPFMKNLEYLYVSDVLAIDYRLEKRPNLMCCFTLTNDLKDVEALTKAVVNLVDYTKNFNLPSKLRDSVSKERSEVEVVFNKMNKNYKEETKNEESSELSSEKVKKLEEKMARKSKSITNVRIKKVK